MFMTSLCWYLETVTYAMQARFCLLLCYITFYFCVAILNEEQLANTSIVINCNKKSGAIVIGTDVVTLSLVT